MKSVLRRLLAAPLMLMAAILLSNPSLAGTSGPAQVRAQAAQAASPVVSPHAKPNGYSLVDMARLTAAFNAGDRTGPPPDSPFQILYDDGMGHLSFDVAAGTYLYVPVVYSDDAPPLLGDFPANVENRRQLRQYWYSQAEIGTVATDVTVDGVHVALSPQYTVGIKLDAPLPDGANNYISPAAFIRPLAQGSHTVEIHFLATGAALNQFPGGIFEFTTTYTVDVH